MRIKNRYRDLYQASLTDPAACWAQAAREVTWTRPPQQILDDTRPPFCRWFPDAELNSCANALDRHVDAGRGGQAALIYDSPVTESQRTITYAELLDATSRFAGALSELGVGKGDRVVIDMPMIPEAVIAMLACARIGAVHSVVFGGFAPHELATRIDDARFEASYLCEHPGYYLSGDGGYLDEDGYLFVMGRIDDVINVAGHRLTTGAMGAVLASHPAVAECAVIGVADEIKDQIPRGFVVLQEGASAEGLASELVKRVRDEIGAVACLKQVDIVAALPKTRSGKILRKTMRDIAHGHHGQPPSTIDGPDVLHTLRPVLRR